MITDITQVEIKRRTRSSLGIKPEKVSFGMEKSNSYDNVVKLDIIYQYWEALYDLRKRTRENVDFMRGRQLERSVVNDAGVTVSEAQYISEQGKTPFVQNIIRPMLKSIEGLFRQDNGESMVVSRKPDSAGVEKMLTNALQYALHINEIKEVDPRTLDYFMLSGLPVQRVGFDYVSELERYDIVIDYIDPNYVFFNSDVADIRGKDLRLIGQINDLSIDDLFVHFASSDQDKTELKRIYGARAANEMPNYNELSKARVQYLDFYRPTEQHKYRVIEVWEKKAVDVIEVYDEIDGSEVIWDDALDKLHEIANQRYESYRAEGVAEEEIPRIHYKYKVIFKWFYKFYTPWGHILREGVSPYKGWMHPYILSPYPLISGEVWGLVEELKDGQEQYNRLHTHMDFLIGTSAKNTLVVDEASLNGQSPEDISSDYRRIGRVLVLKLKDGAKPPFELKNQGLDAAYFNLVGMYKTLMQDLSGVQPALQGQNAGSNVPASRYVAEAEHSAINLKELLEFFASFRKKRDMKVLKMIIQFYKEKRYLAISGSGGNAEKLYDPELIKEESTEFDLVIARGNNSPVYKTLSDEILKDFVMKGMLPLENFLKHTDYPFSKSLLEDIQNTKEQMAQAAGQQQQVA